MLNSIVGMQEIFFSHDSFMNITIEQLFVAQQNNTPSLERLLSHSSFRFPLAFIAIQQALLSESV